MMSFKKLVKRHVVVSVFVDNVNPQPSVMIKIFAAIGLFKLVVMKSLLLWQPFAQLLTNVQSLPAIQTFHQLLLAPSLVNVHTDPLIALLSLLDVLNTIVPQALENVLLWINPPVLLVIVLGDLGVPGLGALSLVEMVLSPELDPKIKLLWMVVLLVMDQPLKLMFALSLAVLLLVFKPAGLPGDQLVLDSTDVDLLPAKHEPDQLLSSILVEEQLVEQQMKPVNVLLVLTLTALDQILQPNATVSQILLLLPTQSPKSNPELVLTVHMLIKPNGLLPVLIVLSVLLIVLMDGLPGLTAIADTSLKTEPTLSHKNLWMVVKLVFILPTEVANNLVLLFLNKIV
jgi:hypothetical protein